MKTWINDLYTDVELQCSYSPLAKKSLKILQRIGIQPHYNVVVWTMEGIEYKTASLEEIEDHLSRYDSVYLDMDRQ